jgi:hypothetical protein
VPTEQPAAPTVIEWKAFWTAIAAALAITLVVLAATGLLWPSVAGLLAVVLAAAVIGISYAVVDACEMWRAVADEHRRRIWAGIIASAVVYLVWTLFAVLVPMTWRYGAVMAVMLVLLSVGVYWSARYLEWHIARNPAPARRAEREDPEALLGHREKVLAAAIRLAKIKGIRVLPGNTPLRSDAGRQYRARRDPGSQSELTSASMERLAIAISEITGEDIPSDWVRYRKEAAAGVYTITRLDRDIMAEVVPYIDDPTPTSITAPALRGIEVDGREYREAINQHERDIGASRKGKSSLQNVKIAHSTRCTDAVTWIAGVQKLYDLAGPWVEPYLDKGLRPPIDWIAHGQTDTLAMMAAAMNVARWRQRQPMNRRKWKAIIIFLDEFSFTAQSRQRILFGRDWVDAGWLASAMFRSVASANIHVHVATQRSTLDHFGDHGGDVIANLAVNSAFASKDWAEIGRMTNDYKLPSPKWPGEYYLLSNAEPLNLKAPYIQSNDPTEPRLHGGATIAEVSWARRHIPRDLGPGLAESEGLAAAGAAYAARHQLVDDPFMTYLTNAEDLPDDDDYSSGEHAETYDAVATQLAALAQQAGLGTPSAPAGGEQRRPDAILTILDRGRTENPDGMTAAQVADVLNAGDDNATAEAVAATLSRMCNRGQIHRISHGRYTTLDQTNTQTNT